MKRIIVFLSFIGLLAACSSDKGRRPSGPAKGVSDDGSGTPLDPVKTEDGKTEDTESIALPLLPESGSSMRLLDARGLTRYYGNVFSLKSFGFMHCERNKPRVPADCFESIFAAEERPAMGSFDLGTPRMNRSPANVNPAANLTLNYTRTLRAALSRECINLVDTEIVQMKAGNVANNKLVKAAKPTAADLDAFLKKLLGLDGTQIQLPVDTYGYAADFETVLAATQDKNAGARNGFVGLCIALAMDPLVFVY